jgi:hypothetical protein
MLFPRRTWALRVTEGMGLHPKSRETTLLVDLLIWSAEQDAKMMQQAGTSILPKPEGILLGAISMVNNHSAVLKTARELQIEPQTAENLLLRMRASAIALAKQNGFESLLRLVRDT